MTETLDADVRAAETPPPDPSAIMQVGMGFWPSKTLLTAVELRLFTLLGPGPLTAAEIAVFDFLDGLVTRGVGVELIDQAHRRVDDRASPSATSRHSPRRSTSPPTKPCATSEGPPDSSRSSSPNGTPTRAA